MIEQSDPALHKEAMHQIVQKKQRNPIQRNLTMNSTWLPCACATSLISSNLLLLVLG